MTSGGICSPDVNSLRIIRGIVVEFSPAQKKFDNFAQTKIKWKIRPGGPILEFQLISIEMPDPLIRIRQKDP